MRQWIAASAAVMLVGLSCSINVSAGQLTPRPSPGSQQGSQGNSHPPSLNQDTEPDPLKDRMEEQASRNRNTERHKRMVADTERLVALSAELKSDVDKTTKNEMSVDVIKKAAEIEKLAHDVKERMKGQ